MLAFREPSKRSKTKNPKDFPVSLRQEGLSDFNDFFGGFGVPSIFSNEGFSSMGRMMDRMHNMASDMFAHFDEMVPMRMHPDSGSQFYSQTIVQSTKLDSNGRPMVEKYRSEAKGKYDVSQGLIGERKQAYANSGTGLEKYGHERMIGNKGRKVVKERVGNNERTSDNYKNLASEDANEFDRHWQMAMGGGPLPLPSGNLYGGFERVKEDRKVDDRRRGDFIPQNWRSENQPVRRTDIQPTIPAPRALPAARPQPVPRNPPRNTQPRRSPAAGA